MKRSIIAILVLVLMLSALAGCAAGAKAQKQKCCQKKRCVLFHEIFLSFFGGKLRFAVNFNPVSNILTYVKIKNNKLFSKKTIDK